MDMVRITREPPNIDIGGKKIISFILPEGSILEIDEERIESGISGFRYLEHRWTLSEIDKILNSIEGKWKIEKYVGFVSPHLYYIELFDRYARAMLEAEERDKLYNEYEAKIENAKENIPEFYFSIKEFKGEEVINNYIYINDSYSSPIRIIFSTNENSDRYPQNVDQTVVTSDFTAKYPVMYIKFLVEYTKESQTEIYQQATLVITSDDRFYLLIDGAFYSLEQF